MSLQVWLPLNGNLKNQGLSDLNVVETSGTIAYDSSGKIGSCLCCSGTVYVPASKVGSIFNNSTMSIAFWYNNNGGETASHSICGFNGNSEGSSGSERIYDFFQYSTKNDFHWSMGTLGGGVLSGVFPDNTWVHVCITYDNGTLKIYLNGTNSYTYTSGSSNYVFDDNYFISFGHNQKLNDFRIYDHCLSQDEIREIAQCLMLHYKLSRPNENIILTSQKVTSGGNASGITTSYESDGSLKVISTSGNGNYRSVYFQKDSNTNVGAELSVGDTYTISVDVKVEEGTKLPTLFINSGNGYKQLQGDIQLGSWIRAYYTSTWADPGTGYGNITLHLGFSSAIGTYYFKNFKLEKGSVATPWCPNSTDDEYTAMGYDNTTEFDCSGYENNGIRTGTISLDSNTPKYITSYKFNSAQIHSDCSSEGLTNFTMAAWVKQTSRTSERACIIIGGIYLTIADTGVVSVYAYGKNPEGYLDGTTIIPLNTWTHIAATWDDSYVYIYVNGVLDTKISCTGTATGGYSLRKQIGYENSGDRIFAGSMSDVRIYATTLSADDIKSLYSESIQIDENETAHAYEFREE